MQSVTKDQAPVIERKETITISWGKISTRTGVTLPDDPHVAKLLEQYHLKGVSDKKQISKLLLEEHGLTLSESSISRRKRKLGLRGSHITTLELSDDLKRQLILDQMAKDPAGKLGPRIVKQAIFEETGIQLTRDYIRAEMRTLDPVAHSARVPAHVRAKQLHTTQNASSSEIPHTLEDHSPAERYSHSLSQPPDAIRMSDSRTFSHPPPSAFSTSYPPSSPSSPSSSAPSEADMDIDNHEFAYPPPIPHLPQTHETSLNVPSRELTRPSAPSPSMTIALGILQDATPKMEALTQTIGALDTEEPLDAETYEMVLKAMESAALLERQLSRFISRTRFRGP